MALHREAVQHKSPLRKAGSVLRTLWFLTLWFASGQSIALTQEQVFAGAETLYRQRLTELDSQHNLDSDAAFHSRVTRIYQALLAQAILDNPQTMAWPWELHTTADAEESASCMAGGRLLVSDNYVRRLRLSDSELAMLISHEMQHAILMHHQKELEEAVRLDPHWERHSFAALQDAVDNDIALMTRLSDFNALQETEADEQGMRMAQSAGWLPRLMVTYFRKAARASAYPNFSSLAHPSPASRWARMRVFANLLR